MPERLTAVILAGGLGTRLRSVVNGVPKPLAEVGGRPFIEYLLDWISVAGVPRAVVCTGYKSGMLSERLGDSYRDMKIAYSREETPMGTGGALRLALPAAGTGPFLVLNADTYCPFPIGNFVNFHRAKKADISMALSCAGSSRESGLVEVDLSGRVLGFREKIQEDGPCLVNAGSYIIQEELVSRIPPGEKISLEREVFPRWIEKRFYGFRCGRPVLDIGTPWGYEAAKRSMAP